MPSPADRGERGTMKSRKTDTARLARMALLTAVALTIFAAEAQIPPLVPVPGVKLGLANIITVYAMFALGPRETLAILLARILLGSLFAGQMMSLLFSLAGGLLCYAAMLPLRRILTARQIWVCSVIGAVCHNIGQILVAAAVSRSLSVAVYLPVLMLSGIISGTFTGLCAQLAVNRMGRNRPGGH